MPTSPIKSESLPRPHPHLRLLPEQGQQPYRPRPAGVDPGAAGRTRLIAVVLTLLVHAAVAGYLWYVWQHPPLLQPPKPLEVSMVTPPPPPAVPPRPETPPRPPDTPPPPEELPSPPVEPPPPVEETPPPPVALEPPPPDLPPPPPPDPEPVAVPLPPPPPPPPPVEVKREVKVKKKVVKAPKPVKAVKPKVVVKVAPPQPETPTPIQEPVREPAPAPLKASPPAPVAEPKAQPVDLSAAYLNNPTPSYPRAARRLGIEGTVVLRVLVSPQGKALQVEIAKSSGAQVLDEAARNGVKGWTFSPARQGDRAITATVNVPIKFNLK